MAGYTRLLDQNETKQYILERIYGKEHWIVLGFDELSYHVQMALEEEFYMTEKSAIHLEMIMMHVDDILLNVCIAKKEFAPPEKVKHLINSQGEVCNEIEKNIVVSCTKDNAKMAVKVAKAFNKFLINQEAQHEKPKRGNYRVF